jgi:hypothetical protein
MRYVLCALVPLILAAAAPAADEERVEKQGEVTYTIPEGWERGEREGIVVLTPKDTSPEQCALVVTPGETLPASGDFEKWFGDKWEALRKKWKVVQGGQRSGKSGPNGSRVLVQSALLEAIVDDQLVRSGLMLYAVHVGDAVHWVVFKTDSAKLFNEHKKTVNTFLAGLKFSQTTVEVKPRPKDDAKPRGKVRSDRSQPPQVLKADPN